MYTLHPTPYTLIPRVMRLSHVHPTPYTLHPTPSFLVGPVTCTPYTLHPHSLHPTPYALSHLHPTPYTLIPHPQGEHSHTRTHIISLSLSLSLSLTHTHTHTLTPGHTSEAAVYEGMHNAFLPQPLILGRIPRPRQGLFRGFFSVFRAPFPGLEGCFSGKRASCACQLAEKRTILKGLICGVQGLGFRVSVRDAGSRHAPSAWVQTLKP
jgi:hypothetical protein